jgi:hypothetical protein
MWSDAVVPLRSEHGPMRTLHEFLNSFRDSPKGAPSEMGSPQTLFHRCFGDVDAHPDQINENKGRIWVHVRIPLEAQPASLSLTHRPRRIAIARELRITVMDAWLQILDA